MDRKLKTVLIIEDDHDIRVTLRQVFEDANYIVLTATNGVQAFELLKQIPAPALIITDLMMPIMDGETFLRKTRELPKVNDVPVIIISATFQKFCNFPNVICLPKPLDLFKLIKSADGAIQPELIGWD